LPLFKLDTFPLFLGNAGYLYLIGTAILPLAQSMNEPRRFSAALNPSIVMVTVLNLAFGLFAYIQYGGPEGRVCDSIDTRTGSGLGCVQDNVLKNLTPGLSTHLVKTFLVIDILFTCIVFLFPINEAIEQEVFGSAVSPVVTKPGWFTLDTWRRNLSRAVITCSIGVVAYCVPFFSLLTGLTGGFGNNILGFILPPLFYYKLREHDGFWKQPRSYAVLAEMAGIVVTVTFGIFFLFLTLIVFGKQIVAQRG
jgi:amino acid permease